MLLVRALFYTLTGANAEVDEYEPLTLGMVEDIPYIVGAGVLCLATNYLLVGKERSKKGWEMGRGLVAPIVVIGVVLGSIYGGITGITEAAGMGVIAVFIIGLIRREMTFEIVWDSLMRTCVQLAPSYG